MVVYDFTKASADLDLLAAQVRNSADISAECLGCVKKNDSLSVLFVSSLDQNEQDALSAIVSSHDSADGGQYQRNVYIKTPTSGFLQKEEWWESVDEEDNYVGLVWRRTYTYIQGKLLYYYEDEEFFKDGTQKSYSKIEVYAKGTDYIEKRVTS